MDHCKFDDENVALYLNFPFCWTICSYCHYIDNLSFGYRCIPAEYMELFLKQLDVVCAKIQKPLKSIYFGGGTPSLLTDEQIVSVQKVLVAHNIVSLEVSIELHPSQCNFDYANNQFFNRYSIGVQSFTFKILKTYRREKYNAALIEHMVAQIRKISASRDINIDLVFNETILPQELVFLNEIQPDTITIYPNTKGRGVERLKNVLSTIMEIRGQLGNYSPLGDSGFIYIRKGRQQSYYAKNEYELCGEIIGIGHNSITYCGESSFLCRYDQTKKQWNYQRKDNENRKLLMAIIGLPIGITKRSVLELLPGIYSIHLLLTVNGQCDVSDRHTVVASQELVYLPEYNYLIFYDYISKITSVPYQQAFLATIGYGDSDFKNIQFVYNNLLQLCDREKDYMMQGLSKLYANNELRKLSMPKSFILVEGIDGSGKDTFVRMLGSELKKRFVFSETSRLSVVGQPNSCLSDGEEAKRFIEDIQYVGGASHVHEVLRSNRIMSESVLMSLPGIVICIRGFVTDKATFEWVFQTQCVDFGEGKMIPRWDYYIVIDTDSTVANARIEARGVPRTWRENIAQLEYFRTYYLNFFSALFTEKRIIYNDTLENLKKCAVVFANELYKNEYCKKVQ